MRRGRFFAEGRAVVRRTLCSHRRADLEEEVAGSGTRKGKCLFLQTPAWSPPKKCGFEQRGIFQLPLGSTKPGSSLLPRPVRKEQGEREVNRLLAAFVRKDGAVLVPVPFSCCSGLTELPGEVGGGGKPGSSLFWKQTQQEWNFLQFVLNVPFSPSLNGTHKAAAKRGNPELAPSERHLCSFFLWALFLRGVIVAPGWLPGAGLLMLNVFSIRALYWKTTS